MKKNPSAKKVAAALTATGLLSLAAAPAASAAMSSTSNPCSPGTTMQQSGACGAKKAGSMNSMYKKKNPCAAKTPCAAKMKKSGSSSAG